MGRRRKLLALGEDLDVLIQSETRLALGEHGVGRGIGGELERLVLPLKTRYLHRWCERPGKGTTVGPSSSSGVETSSKRAVERDFSVSCRWYFGAGRGEKSLSELSASPFWLTFCVRVRLVRAPAHCSAAARLDGGRDGGHDGRALSSDAPARKRRQQGERQARQQHEGGNLEGGEARWRARAATLQAGRRRWPTISPSTGQPSTSARAAAARAELDRLCMGRAAGSIHHESTGGAARPNGVAARGDSWQPWGEAPRRTCRGHGSGSWRQPPVSPSGCHLPVLSPALCDGRRVARVVAQLRAHGTGCEAARPRRGVVSMWAGHAAAAEGDSHHAAVEVPQLDARRGAGLGVSRASVPLENEHRAGRDDALQPAVGGVAAVGRDADRRQAEQARVVGAE